MGSYWTNAVRHPEDIGVGHIRRTVDYSEFSAVAQADGTPALALPIGCLEAGAVPLRVHTYVATAVAGGTPAMTLGTATGATAFALAADLAASATGVKTAATGTSMGIPLAADTVFYAYISASASAGKVTLTVEFVNKRESIVRPFPNN